MSRSRGQKIEYRYDGLNRLRETIYPFKENTVYTYGNSPEDNNAGRIVSITDEAGSTAFTYGAMGETKSMQRTIIPLSSAQKLPVTNKLLYAWDYLGRLSEVTYPDGETISYGYDRGGQVISVGSSKDTGTYRNFYVSDIGYDEYGQRVYIEYGNGVVSHYEYDPYRRLLDNIKTEGGTGDLYQNISYTFDDVGNIAGTDNNSRFHRVTQTYSYDGLYQLTEAKGKFERKPTGMTPDFTSSYLQNFNYDEIGNITRKESSGNQISQDLIYSGNYRYETSPHRPVQVGDMWYLYDGNGNMVEERRGGHSPEGEIEISTITRTGDLYALDYGVALDRRNQTNTNDGVYTRRYVWD